MHTLKLVSALALLATSTQAIQINSPAIKDSTIIRSTVRCGECPERDCYQCRYGDTDTLRANTGGLAWLRSLVGFRLPEGVNPSDISKCTVQFPGFVELPEFAFNMTVVPAVSSDVWDEITVTGSNAPNWWDDNILYHVPANTNPPLLDVTDACWNAADDGQFSIYIGSQFGSYEIWSKDSGNPAILHVYYD